MARHILVYFPVVTQRSSTQHCVTTESDKQQLCGRLAAYRSKKFVNSFQQEFLKEEWYPKIHLDLIFAQLKKELISSMVTNLKSPEIED